MDDRGHGRTTALADPRKLKNWNPFAEDLERFVDQLGRPVIAMGHSRGGVVSLLLALKRPDLVRALILIDPTILPFWWMWWWYLVKKAGIAKFAPIVATAAKRKRIWPGRETILKAYRTKRVFRSWSKGFLEAYITESTHATGQGTIKLSCEPAWESRCFAVCPHDVWRYIPLIRQPTLVLYGAESDTFLPAAVKRFKTQVPLATFKCFEKTSHFVPMERPDECAQDILASLRKKGVIQPSNDL